MFMYYTAKGIGDVLRLHILEYTSDEKINK